MADDQRINSEVGANEPPRNRSSTFGIQYDEPSDTQLLSRTTSQITTRTQINGPLPPQTPTSQTGASAIRPTSIRQTLPPQGLGALSTPSAPTTEPNSAATSRSATSTSKSPFSTPITSPPRTRPNQILLVNPTSTLPLTSLILNTIRPLLPQSLELTAYTASYPAPSATESTTDHILASEPILRDLARYSTNNSETIQNYDAILIASYTAHPLIAAMRESYDVPVIGILEASLYVARMLGARFGIITTSTRMKIQIADAVTASGLGNSFVGVESLHINPLELLSTPFLSYFSTAHSIPPTQTPSQTQTPPPTGQSQTQSTPATPSTTPGPSTAFSRTNEELHRRLATQARTLINRGADTLILGSEFLCSTEASRAVKDAVREADGRRLVNVIDAVEAGIMMLNGLVGLGVPTSKKGLFRGEREGRRGRGQNWF